MTNFPEMIRNVAVAGHLHHGKTALMDMLVFETHKLVWDADKPVSNLPLQPLNRIKYLLDTIHGYSYIIARTPYLHQIVAHVPCIVNHVWKITSYTFH